MVKKHSEISGNTYAIFIPTLNPEEPESLPHLRCRTTPPPNFYLRPTETYLGTQLL